jgi:hypothetical protein
MTNYLTTQRNKYSSAVIAYLNALKWRFPESSITYEQWYLIASYELRTTQEGTKIENLEYGLEDRQIYFKKTRLLKEVQNHLKAGNPVIIFHLDENNEWHYSFWYEYKFGRYRGANMGLKSKKVKSITDKTMRMFLLKNDDFEFPQALLLKMF